MANLMNPLFKVGTYGLSIFSIPVDSTPESLSFSYEFKDSDGKSQFETIEIMLLKQCVCVAASG